MKRSIILFSLVIFGAICAVQVFAQQEPSQQERMRQLQEEEERLRKRIEKKKEEPRIEEEAVKEKPKPVVKEKVFIQEIKVSGSSLFSHKEIREMVKPFENRQLDLAQMQEVADTITRLYRQRGYISSRAYLPPQKIEDNILEIEVVEGLVGALIIKGNRYFKTKLLQSRLRLKKQDKLNYNVLRDDLININKHPDRSVRAVLLPAKEFGQTDIILEVKDRLPVHLGFDWDNFGSRFIERDRYSGRISHNNLLGFDDKLVFQYQLAETGRYFLKNIRYLVPANKKTELGLFAVFSRAKLGKTFEDIDARGKVRLYGLFVNYLLLETKRLNLNFNLGFDYKDITNYQNETVSSTDRLRVAKFSLDMDLSDNFGRTVIINELDLGIPNIVGGLRKQDSKASRSGSGGKFSKTTINILRLQALPFSSSLFMRSQIQLASYILTSSEQFQIGGIGNVRGYPPAEVVGDKGYSMSWELLFPLYFFPRHIRVPFSEVKFFKAVKLALFYDWARAKLRRPQATEEKTKTLRGAGFGIRFNLPIELSFRLDFAWPLDNAPSDGDHRHTWISISKSF